MALFLTTEEAARLLGVSAYTVRRYIHDGKLDARKFIPHGKLRIPEESVLNLIDQHNTGGDK